MFSTVLHSFDFHLDFFLHFSLCWTKKKINFLLLLLFSHVFACSLLLFFNVFFSLFMLRILYIFVLDTIEYVVNTKNRTQKRMYFVVYFCSFILRCWFWFLKFCFFFSYLHCCSSLLNSCNNILGCCMPMWRI